MRRISLLRANGILLALLVSCSGNDNADKKTIPQTADQSPSTAAALASSGIQFTAQDILGKAQSSDQWIGKRPVVLNFWGTWCPPCRREVPDIVKAYSEYHSKGVEILGLAVKDDPQDVASFSKDKGMNWIMLIANDQVLTAYNVVNGIPTTIFLDKNGNEVTRFIGSRSYEDFKPAFEAILKGYSGETLSLK
jgi:thiol-disulfide isomerase/thioredoxin